MNGLSGRVALVTGATGLIGGAITGRLAGEGAVVLVASRQLERARMWIRRQGHSWATNLVPLELDLSDEASIDSAFDRLDQDGRESTILIANASSRDALGTPFDQVSHDDFRRLFEVDVAGHFLCARALVERLRESEAASIVFLSSIYANVGVDPAIYPEGMAPTSVQYATVKSALTGLVRYLAALWGRSNIRVNAVVAGGVRSVARQPDEFVHNFSRKTMLGRMADPEEIANMVALLASDEASYITGECLLVDGGFTSL